MRMVESYLKIISDSYGDVLPFIGVGMSIVFFLGTVLFLLFLGKRKGWRWSARLLLIECFFLLLSLTVLFRSVGTTRSFNFTPFWSYRFIREGHELLLTQAIANVVAFIPIGLLLGISFPDIKWWKVLLIGSAFSLLIETLQFFLRRGFAEFDDVWHNGVGVMVGYGIYVGIAYLIKRQSKKRPSAEDVLINS